MPMSMVLRKEDGTEIERSDLPIFSSSLSALARQVPMLIWLDAYGDTVYNGRQRERLIEEIVKADSDDQTQPVLREIRRLCESAKAPHRYLWFIGD